MENTKELDNAGVNKRAQQYVGYVDRDLSHLPAEEMLAVINCLICDHKQDAVDIINETMRNILVDKRNKEKMEPEQYAEWINIKRGWRENN